MSIEFKAILCQSRRRWFINVVLVLAVIGFVGFSLFPLISTAFKESQPSHVATPLSPSQPPVAGEKSQLEEQARVMNWFCREPENQTALRGLVQARIQLRDLKGSHPGKANSVESEQTEVQLILGQVYATQQRYDEAIAVYDQAIKANNQDFRPVLAKASILNQQGKTEQAKALFKNAAALAPTQYKEEINRLATEEPTVKESRELRELREQGRIELTALCFGQAPKQATIPKTKKRHPQKVSVRSDICPASIRPPSAAIIAQIACPRMAPVVTPTGFFACC